MPGWSPAETTAHRVIRLLERRGVIGDTFEYDAFAEEHPILAGMTFASTKMQVAGGARAGRPVRRILQDPAEGIKPEKDELKKNRGKSKHRLLWAALLEINKIGKIGDTVYKVAER